MRHFILAGLFAAASALPATADTVTIGTATGPVMLEAEPETIVVFDVADGDPPSLRSRHCCPMSRCLRCRSRATRG